MPGMVSALEIQKEVELNMIYLRSLHMHFFLSSASSSPSLPLPPPFYTSCSTEEPRLQAIPH